MSEEAFVIRAFTLNCWGIVFVSKNRRARMQAIAKHLANSDLDFVCLQEVWTVKDFLYLSQKCRDSLPYKHYFNSGVNGPGLGVLSKHPIVNTYFHKWLINGYPHKIHQGDWFGGKGVGLCRIEIGNRTVNLYTTHLHAEYDTTTLEYLNHRILQSFDTSQFIKLTSQDCDLAILAGDLNSEPEDPAIPLLLLNAQLQDCFTVAQKKNVDCPGTNEGFRNSYTPARELKRQPEGKRIDYIMYKHSPRFHVDVLEYLFPLPDRVPGCSFSYSDHEAIEVVLQCYPQQRGGGGGDASDSRKPDNNHELAASLSKAIQICQESLNQLNLTKIKYCTAASIFAVAVILSLFLEVIFPIYDSVSIIFYNLLKVVLTALLLFTLFMGIIWNRIEKSAVLTGKYSMRTLLEQTKARI